MINLEKHPLILSVIEYAKKRRQLKFSPQDGETQEADLAAHIPYRQGFSSVDVTGFWSPDSLSTYVKGNIAGYKTGLEFGFFRAFGFLSLSLPWSAWTWVVDSFECMRFDVVNENLDKVKNRKKNDELRAQYKELLKAVTEEQMLEYVNRHYVKVSPSMWVSTTDPSLIVYDNRTKPYAMKDGWNKAQLGEILAEWFEYVTGDKIETKYVENSRW